MRHYIFFFLLIIICFLGLYLRLIDYDRIPGFTETQDEFFYPWAGMTMLTTGTPVAWSWFPSYEKREIVTYWGAKYPLVSPWIEKPPLFSLLSGAWVLLNEQTQLNQVRLSTTRLVPIGLSFWTIVFTGILAYQVFGKKVGIVASLLYATIPLIVVSNRLSLTENLLTPLSLLTIIILIHQSPSNSWNWWQPVLAGISAAATVATKNIGIVSVFIVIIYFVSQKKWQSALIVCILGGIGVLVHPAMGFYYNWKLFVDVLDQYKLGFINEGLPELVQTLFTYPAVTTKDRLLPDGAIFLGYVLLFSSPLWFLWTKKTSDETQNVSMLREKYFLAFPISYTLLLAFLASGRGFSFYGWHIYPVFPYIMILLTKVLVNTWTSPQILQLLMLSFTLGSTAIRNLLMFQPREIHYRWQAILLLTTVCLLGIRFLPQKIRQVLFLGCFVMFIVLESYTAVHLIKIYPAMTQPW